MDTKIHKKKLIFFVHGGPIGGAEQVTLYQARKLKSRYHIEFLCLYAGHFYRQLLKLDYSVYPLSYNHIFSQATRKNWFILFPLYVGALVNVIIRLQTYLKEVFPSILYLVGYKPFLIYSFFPVLETSQVYWHVHDVIQQKLIVGWMRLRSVYINRIFFVSKVALKPFEGIKNSIVINNNINFNEIKTTVRKSKFERFHFGIVGRIHPDKDLLPVIKLFEKLPELKKTKLFIYGANADDKYYARLMKLIKRYPKNIFYKKHESDKNKMYQSFEILISNSKTEAYPLNILESMKLGKIIICKKIEAIDQLLSEKNALLYNKIDELQLILEKILSGKIDLNSLQKNILRRYRALLVENAFYESQWMKVLNNNE